jgi:hypothetical protein
MLFWEEGEEDETKEEDGVTAVAQPNGGQFVLLLPPHSFAPFSSFPV